MTVLPTCEHSCALRQLYCHCFSEVFAAVCMGFISVLLCLCVPHGTTMVDKVQGLVGSGNSRLRPTWGEEGSWDAEEHQLGTRGNHWTHQHVFLTGFSWHLSMTLPHLTIPHLLKPCSLSADPWPLIINPHILLLSSCISDAHRFRLELPELQPLSSTIKNSNITHPSFSLLYVHPPSNISKSPLTLP